MWIFPFFLSFFRRYSAETSSAVHEAGSRGGGNCEKRFGLRCLSAYILSIRQFSPIVYLCSLFLLQPTAAVHSIHVHTYILSNLLLGLSNSRLQLSPPIGVWLSFFLATYQGISHREIRDQVCSCDHEGSAGRFTKIPVNWNLGTCICICKCVRLRLLIGQNINSMIVEMR